MSSKDLASPFCGKCGCEPRGCECEEPCLIEGNSHLTNMVGFYYTTHHNHLPYDKWLKKYDISYFRLAYMFDKDVSYFNPDHVMKRGISAYYAIAIHLISAYEVDIFSMAGIGARDDLLEVMQSVGTFRENALSKGNKLVAAHVEKRQEHLQELSREAGLKRKAPFE